MNRLARTTAVVLAGGAGTRLRAAVADRPKVLAEVNGRPFLALLLDSLAETGIKKVVLCTGYMAAAVEASLGDSHDGMQLVYSVEKTPLGTGGALRMALPLLDSSVLVCNGDSFSGADLDLFAKRHADAGSAASLLLSWVEDAGRYGVARLSADNRVICFSEKGSSGCGLINAGVYLLDKTLIESIPAGKEASLEREVFPRLIAHGLYGFHLPGPFLDIGIPSDYYRAADFFASWDRLTGQPKGQI